MSACDIALKAPNQSVEVGNGLRYAYRPFGAASAATLPLVMLQHFRGNLGDWDPLMPRALASDREVIPLENTGVSLSSETVPGTIGEMARHVVAFTDGLGLSRIRIYPDSGHGFLFQWPEQFAGLVHSFLGEPGDHQAV